MELVGTTAAHYDILTSLTHNVEFAVKQKETIADMVLYCAYESEFNNDGAKLCGLKGSPLHHYSLYRSSCADISDHQLITSLDRKLPLECTETGDRVREEPWFQGYSASTEYRPVCGIQIALEAVAVVRVGLAFQKVNALFLHLTCPNPAKMNMTRSD